ncbi:MAG: 23S rRNA (adenine(2503)-C(2))-methyltransferase RlmN [Mariprofundaceae bacterium]|nr:23S rRNA (adenine(2503)-C(2))-methyltransferase RlmN [Mariprofundaceae bacterium]
MTAMLHGDLLDLCRQAGVKEVHADTLRACIFRRGERDFLSMHGLPKLFTHWLKAHVCHPSVSVLHTQVDTDHTQKMLLRLPYGGEVESVLIPAAGRITQCISSQVGCAMACTFCLTATAGLQRNLHTSEMIAQLMQAKWLMGSYPRNVVLMGMGEPLHNYNAVARFVWIATDPAGIALSPRRITLSTSGLVPAIKRMQADNLPCNLAVSLNASNDTVRNDLMPVNHKYPLSVLMPVLRDFSAQTKRKRVLIEYVLIDGVNDTLKDAMALVDLLADLPCTVNLLPLNTHHGTSYRRSSDAAVQQFWQTLNSAGYVAVVRQSRGQNISAACGQLKAENIPPKD